MKNVTPRKLEMQRGFTLIELMIVVVIVAILASVAIPSYRDSVMRGKRADGKTALSDVASKQEQYFMDNRSYTTDMTLLGYAASPADSPEGDYKVSLVAATAGCPITNCYVLQAVPQGGQAGDSCGTLTLNSLTVKGPANCW